MEFVMPTWLYVVIALAVMAGLYKLKVRWFNKDLPKPMDREGFMFNLFLWVFIVYLGFVWPVTLICAVGFGIGLAGYEVYKRVKR